MFVKRNLNETSTLQYITTIFTVCNDTENKLTY